jgi:amidase
MPSDSSSAVLSAPGSRRAFLKHATIGTAALAVASRLATSPARAASTDSAYPVSTDTTDDLIYMSATKLAQLIRAKKVSAVEATQACIDRIEHVNPKLNAVCMPCFERALEEAKAADAALARGDIKGPLHGVPMTIKDSFDAAGVVSTGGTLGRMTYVPEKDATAVTRARKAGAILLGKSNTPEFTLAGLPGLSTTWNPIYGVTRNPYNIWHSASGSSGGAGSIVAAGGAFFDIGSDFGGSIRGPAHANGVAGIKPTTGRVPRTGHIVDFGGVFDPYQQVGPLARKVEDIELVTRIIAGPDYKDAAIKPAPLFPSSNVDLSKLRVAYYFSNGLADPTAETHAALKKALDALTATGAKAREDIHPFYKEAVELRWKLRGGEAYASVKRLADKWKTKVVSPSFTFGGPMCTTAEFTEMMEKQDFYRSAMLSWIKDYDVILCPASHEPAPRIDDNPNYMLGYTSVYNVSGWPATVVRGGTSPTGLPIGIQVVAQPFREDVTFAVAKLIEKELGGWKKPNLL